MIEIIYANGKNEYDIIDNMKKRSSEVGKDIEETAQRIMEDIERRKWDAVREYSLKFDGSEPYELTQDEIEASYNRCPPDLIEAMEKAAENIRSYQSKLLVETEEWSTGKGIRLGCLVRGLNRLGIYVPGGTAAYPSSVLMSAIPARVAGVDEIIMVTPPTTNLNDAVLAAAKIAKVDRVIAVGGIQAVGALTYGAGFIPRVDKLVGPGNAYVTAAKRLAYGTIDIDMIAGPSEILIIADRSANPAYIAADLMSQAEHDVLSSAILVTDNSYTAKQTVKKIEYRAQQLQRRDIIEASLRDFGAIIVCETIDKMIEIANEIAPEHLEIITKDPRSMLPKIRNAGAIFLGEYSPEPLGDYMAGPSHVLPTSGTARFFSPLSVDSFLKKTSVIEYSRDALAQEAQQIITFAKSESLTAHAESIRVRFDN
ncbi:MAG: histidinol dehydrogenase [Clostridiales bacterium]|jgi:histidinol dehydrogenase|nr:histidinol dehydrogenase [Clostridiales bacterium]